MEVALCSRSFENATNQNKMTFENIISQALSHKIAAIDILSTHVPNSEIAKSYLSLLHNNNQTVANYSTRLTSLMALNPSSLNIFEEEFTIASTLNSPYISIRTNFEDEEANEDLLLHQVIAGYQILINVAKRYNLKILVENVKSISQDPTILETLVNRFNGDLFLCLDMGNFPANYRYSAINRLCSLAKHCHFKTWAFDDYGLESEIDTEICIYLLTQNNFKGYVAIEYEGDVDEINGVNRSIKLLRKHLHDLR